VDREAGRDRRRGFDRARQADGRWAAFRLAGRDFYARAETDHVTGRVLLTEIPDPYVCEVCGLGYQDGPHEHGRPQKPGTLSTHYAGPPHDHRPRGDYTKGGIELWICPVCATEYSRRPDDDTVHGCPACGRSRIERRIEKTSIVVGAVVGLVMAGLVMLGFHL
jgi:hypothetical protein